METKFHDLDVKVTGIATNVEKFKEDVEAKLSSDDDDALPTTTQFQTMSRPTVVVVTSNAPATETAPAAVPTTAPPVSNPLVQQTSLEAFADALSSTLIDPHQSCKPEGFIASCC